jgi:hypothetical protein
MTTKTDGEVPGIVRIKWSGSPDRCQTSTEEHQAVG